MKTIGVIPARWASTRFEGKILADLNGQPLLQHVWNRACQAQKLDQVLIACDQAHVKDVCEGFGAQVVLTDPDLASGSDRIAAAVAEMDVDIVVNIQGDEPLMPPDLIDQLIDALSQDQDSVVATAARKIDNADDIANPNVVKVVIDGNNRALYFSRSAIPYDREDAGATYYKHFGIYAYRKDFLMTYKDLPKSTLEETEKLEQLRILEAGYHIQVVKTEANCLGVDTPEDLEHVKKVLNNA